MSVQVVLKRVFYKGHVCFELPAEPEYVAAIVNELKKCRDKHNDYALVTIQPPKRPRTTGEGSQNHHLNGHIMQLCQYTGYTYDEIKYCIKMIAVEQFGYPFTNVDGYVIPQGEHECSTEDCAKLIEAAHFMAAEFGVILKE